MRIMHICQPVDGGSAVVVRMLAQAGVGAGDDVTVVSPAGGLLPGWARSAGATWVELPMTRSPRLRDLVLLARLRGLVRGFDVVHTHSSKAGALGRLAVRSLGRDRPRSVFTPHGWSFYVGGRAAGAYRWFERVAARATDAITVVSRTELEDGSAVLGHLVDGRPDLLALIENGVDLDDFSPTGPVAAREPAPLLVQVGRLSEQKGQDRSIRALARLADPTVRLRLVGDGPLEPALRALAAELGVAGRVEFTGLADPRPHLRAADVVLLPSRWEGMSLALLEAMATGNAIVSSDCGGSDALGDTGVLVPSEGEDVAVERLARGVEGLLLDPEERARLGYAAWSRARERYSVARVMAEYARVWRGQQHIPGVPTPVS